MLEYYLNMDTRKTSVIIIILCALSIFTGLVSAVISPTKKASSNESNRSSFTNIFSDRSKIALITLEGPITSESSGGLIGEMYSAESVYNALKRANKDSSVKGVILKIDSPGGTVALSQEIYNSILRLRNKKPVVVSMGDVAASGGYYIASAADRIWADPGTLTGSIGVIFSTIDAGELLNQKLGIKTNVIKSGKFKDIGSPYRSMTQDERSLLQDIINSTYEQFVNAIVAGRVKRQDNYSIEKSDLTVQNLKKYADGRIFTGVQAKKLGFVDQVGGLYEAENGIKDMINDKFHIKSKNLTVVSYNRPSGLGELLFNTSESLFNRNAFGISIPTSAKYPRQPLFLWE